MKQKNKMLSHKDVKTLFETRLTQLTSLAAESRNETIFKNKLNDYLLSAHIKNPIAAKNIARLIENDSKTKVALSEEQEQALLDFIAQDNCYQRYYDDVLILLKTGLA